MVAANSKKAGEPVRLYTRGVVMGYKRSKVNQYVNTSLIKLDGVADTKSAEYYLGKRLAYVYKAKTKAAGPGGAPPSRFRVMWGKVTRTHGNSGVVRAKFRKNLPPSSLGAKVRVMMFPQH